MIFEDIEFYNIREFEFDKKHNAYNLLRLSKSVEENMPESGIKFNRSSLGVELRFFMVDDEISITLRGYKEDGGFYIYYGDLEAEYNQFTTVIRMNEEITIKLKRNPNIKEIEQINKAKESIYPSDLIRIILYGSMVQFVRKTGKTKAVESKYKNILFYGSSITGNCISLIPNNGYPFLVSKKLKLDLLNLGYPGSCTIDKKVADELIKIKFDYAFFELGVNIIEEITLEEYKSRCLYLLEKMSKINKPIFVTDIYPYYNLKYAVSDEKLNSFRKVLKELTSKYENVIYIKSNKLLKTKTNLCADLIHPDIDGHFEIYKNLSKIIENYIKSNWLDKNHMWKTYGPIVVLSLMSA